MATHAELVFESFWSSAGKYLGVLLGLVTITAVGFSLRHDSSWNTYVDGKFNMNLGPPKTKLEADQYLDVTSQEEWISLIQRPYIMEAIVLSLITITMLLKLGMIIFIPLTPKESVAKANTRAGFIILLSAVLESAGAIAIIASVIAADDNTNRVMELIHKPKTSWPSSPNDLTLESSDVEADLYINVYCDSTIDYYKWTTPKQCQLTWAKILGAVLCFISSLNSLIVSFLLICDGSNKVMPTEPMPEDHIATASANENALRSCEETLQHQNLNDIFT